ncbi:hypothetical protein CDD82_7937 [Ophiocordyceps australis]|uniref:Uncharacterized protein n=1 Tax=Ophiocordyceps australis TaxID=1399860 RepID=A0A2C5YPG0_9HYPO|nr:hypothetical protein CDD82_7937 [Ophiocordyceps australis]
MDEITDSSLDALAPCLSGIGTCLGADVDGTDGPTESSPGTLIGLMDAPDPPRGRAAAPDGELEVADWGSRSGGCGRLTVPSPPGIERLRPGCEMDGLLAPALALGLIKLLGPIHVPPPALDVPGMEMASKGILMGMLMGLVEAGEARRAVARLTTCLKRMAVAS